MGQPITVENNANRTNDYDKGDNAMNIVKTEDLIVYELCYLWLLRKTEPDRYYKEGYYILGVYWEHSQRKSYIYQTYTDEVIEANRLLKSKITTERLMNLVIEKCRNSGIYEFY